MGRARDRVQGTWNSTAMHAQCGWAQKLTRINNSQRRDEGVLEGMVGMHTSTRP